MSAGGRISRRRNTAYGTLARSPNQGPPGFVDPPSSRRAVGFGSVLGFRRAAQIIWPWAGSAEDSRPQHLIRRRSFDRVQVHFGNLPPDRLPVHQRSAHHSRHRTIRVQDPYTDLADLCRAGLAPNAYGDRDAGFEQPRECGSRSKRWGRDRAGISDPCFAASVQVRQPGRSRRAPVAQLDRAAAF